MNKDHVEEFQAHLEAMKAERDDLVQLVGPEGWTQAQRRRLRELTHAIRGVGLQLGSGSEGASLATLALQ